MINQPQVDYIPNWMTLSEATTLFQTLSSKINWQTEEIKIFGQTKKVPRLVSFCGDHDINYHYSGQNHPGTGWFDFLIPIKNRLQKEGYHFNFVLLNYYQNGDDYMGWHSDNEKELGKNPLIASLSLGANRKFCFRLKKNHFEKFSISLDHGSLLLMKDHVQKDWQHSLPKSKEINSPRINLTFRLVKSFK